MEINKPQFKVGDKVRFLKKDDGFYNSLRKNSIGVIESIGKTHIPFNYVYWIKFKNSNNQVYEYQLELVKDKPTRENRL